MHKIISVVFLFLFAGEGLCAGNNASPAPDPYFLQEQPIPAGATPSRDVSAKTLSGNGQTLNTSVQNCIIIAAGQSNNANTAPDAYTPTNGSSIDNLNIYDGAIYKAVDPQLGTSSNVSGTTYGNPQLRVADTLITNGKCSRVILVPVSIAGTSISYWDPGAGNGQDPLAQRIPVALTRIAQRGITCGAAKVTCVILWGQGETDNINGTTSAAYQAAFNRMVALAAAGGFAGRWLIAEQTWYSGAADTTIEAAQAAVVNNTTVFAGPNADALTGNVCVGSVACRVSDNTHWTDAGSASYAAGWVTALHNSGAPF